MVVEADCNLAQVYDGVETEVQADEAVNNGNEKVVKEVFTLGKGVFALQMANSSEVAISRSSLACRIAVVQADEAANNRRDREVKEVFTETKIQSPNT